MIYLNYLLFRCLALGSARHRSRLRTSRLKVSDRRTCFGIAWFKKYINIFFLLGIGQAKRIRRCAKRLRWFANIGGGCGSACAEQPAFVCPANFSGQNKMMSQRTPDAASLAPVFRLKSVCFYI